MLFMRIKGSFLLKIWSQFNLFQFLIQKNRKCLQNQIVISLLTSNTSSLFSCSFHAQSSSATTISVSFWSKISSVTSFAINFVVMLSFAATFQHFLAVLAIETHFVPTRKIKVDMIWLKCKKFNVSIQQELYGMLKTQNVSSYLFPRDFFSSAK